MSIPVCSYKNCDEPVCQYDLEEFPPWMPRMCQAHSDESHRLSSSGDVAGMLRFAAIGQLSGDPVPTAKEEE